MELTDKTFKQVIKDIYFKKSNLSHKEFYDWTNLYFEKLFFEDLNPEDLGISEMTAGILMDIDAQWDLYIINTFSKQELAELNYNEIILPDLYFENWYRELNSEALGYAENFGWNLLEEVENKLINDLNNYRTDRDVLRFDWSDTCIEGHSANVKGKRIENLSNLTLIDYNEEVRYEGWIDFIFEKEHNYLFEVYWDQLTFEKKEIKKFGIPKHIYQKLTNELKTKYEDKVV